MKLPGRHGPKKEDIPEGHGPTGTPRGFHPGPVGQTGPALVGRVFQGWLKLDYEEAWIMPGPPEECLLKDEHAPYLGHFQYPAEHDWPDVMNYLIGLDLEHVRITIERLP